MFKKMGDCTNHNNQKNPHQQRPKTRSGLGHQRSSLEKRRRRDGGNGSTNKRRRRHQKHKQNQERKNKQSF